MVKEQVFFGLNWYLWYNWSISKRQGLKYSLVETEAGLHVLVVKSHWQSPLHQKCPFPWGHNAQVAAAWFPQLTSKYTNREWIISQLSSLDIKLFVLSYCISLDTQVSIPVGKTMESSLQIHFWCTPLAGSQAGCCPPLQFWSHHWSVTP